jgi:hypothetical protein
LIVILAVLDQAVVLDCRRDLTFAAIVNFAIVEVQWLAVRKILSPSKILAGIDSSGNLR